MRKFKPDTRYSKREGRPMDISPRNKPRPNKSPKHTFQSLLKETNNDRN